MGDPASTHQLGKYRFLATLGHGGMAEVFLAAALGPAGFNKLQVIKRLRPSLAEDPDLCAMFLDEARLAARLNHKNVVQTNEVDRVDGQYFMAMEYLDGQPLHRVLGRGKQLGHDLPRPLALRVACEALAGLHYAHELADYDGAPLGVVHRDVSPQNIFVTYDGQVKIVDFGIAKAARRVVETDTGVIKGKLAYMAPEQAFSPSAEVDRRADVFALGVVLWEMLAGRRLWQDMGDPAILGALLDAVPSLGEAAPGLDPELVRVCDRATALRRDDRPATAAALRAELEQRGPVGSAEELGAYVEGLFHERREEMKALLARQVDLVLVNGAGELLDLDRGTNLRASLVSIPPPAALPRDPAVPAPPASPAPSSRPPPSAVLTPSLTPPPSTVTATRPAPAEVASRALFAEHRRPATWGPVAGGALAVGALAALLLTSGGRERPHPAQAPAPSAAPSAPPSPPANGPPPAVAPAVVAPTLPAGAYLQVHLAVNPAEGRILVDGAPLPGNPFDGKLLRDGAVHRLQFEAAGFLPQSRMVVFDRDLALDVALLPRPRGAAPAPSAGMKPDPY